MGKISDFFKNQHKMRWAGESELFTAEEVVEKYMKACPDTSLRDLSKLCAVFGVLPKVSFKSLNKTG